MLTEIIGFKHIFACFGAPRGSHFINGRAKKKCVGLVPGVCKNKEKATDMKDVKWRQGLAGSNFTGHYG